MRATTAVERIEIRRDIIWVPKLIGFFERAGCNHYFGLLGTGLDATELYLEVLRDQYYCRQGGQHYGSEWRKPRCIPA
jgi:hypothetical protein